MMKTGFGLAAAAATLALSAWAGDARAAGVYFSDRGVRPMGRAGAYVAGADDLGSIWYNPAGLADAGTSVLVDFGYLHFQDAYTRQLAIPDAEGTIHHVNSPTVNGGAPFLPVPTMAWSLKLDSKERFTIAGGFLEPQVALGSYPSTVDGQPSSSRYSLGSYDGSILGVLGGWVAWKPLKQLRFGFGVLGLMGQFVTNVTFSTCPAVRLVCAPEQPEFDANSRITVGPFLAPTVNGGVTWVPWSALRFGISGQGPMVVSSDAKLQIQLPTDVAFDSAKVNGSDAHVTFTLPAIFRAGVEVRPLKTLRLEAAYVREFWSEHQTITASPNGMTITGVNGLPPSITVPNIVFPRHFQDAASYRLGGEYNFRVGGFGVDARLGASYEESAVPAGYVSLLSLDMSKVTLSMGGSLHVGDHWRFDFLYAHLFCNSVYVSPSQAMIPHINPINGNAPLEPVNGGTYTAEADLIGLGVNYKF
ncbi:MAG TPA: outer membrane protein transport protein [Polyangiaceae bacterium]